MNTPIPNFWRKAEVLKEEESCFLNKIQEIINVSNEFDFKKYIRSESNYLTEEKPSLYFKRKNDSNWCWRIELQGDTFKDTGGQITLFVVPTGETPTYFEKKVELFEIKSTEKIIERGSLKLVTVATQETSLRMCAKTWQDLETFQNEIFKTLEKFPGQ